MRRDGVLLGCAGCGMMCGGLKAECTLSEQAIWCSIASSTCSMRSSKVSGDVFFGSAPSWERSMWTAALSSGSVGFSGVGSEGVGSSGIDAEWVDVSGIGSAWVDVSGADAEWADASGMDSAWVDVSDFSGTDSE